MTPQEIDEQTPACPGDILVFVDGSRTIVRYAELEHRSERPRGCSCGGCMDVSVYEYKVFVDADEPAEVIAKGGGTLTVLPIQRLRDDWPPEHCQVLRDGVPVPWSKKPDEGGSSTSPPEYPSTSDSDGD